jgi:hypothetical protein
MSPSSVPKGWDKESDSLFIHTTGVRIQRMAYKGKDGWYLVPTDLDQPVVEFEPTPEGRDKAFESFAKGALDLKPRKAKAAAKGKAAATPAPEEPEEEGEEKDDDDDEDEKEEKEEKEEADQGDD